MRQEPAWSAVVASSLLGTIALTRAFWVIGYALPSGHRYEGAWIFGLAWFPLLAFAFIEIMNGKTLPNGALRSWATVLEPYAWMSVSVLLSHDPIDILLVSSGIIAFAAAFTIHPILLFRENLPGKDFFLTIFVPHLFLYIPAGICFFYLLTFTQTHLSPSLVTIAGMAIAYLEKVRAGIMRS